MDLKLVMTAFSMLFLAEMGDKTQLAVLTLSASSGRPLSVFVGAGIALLAVTAIGAFIGSATGRFISPVLLNRAAATSFIAIGLWMWSH